MKRFVELCCFLLGSLSLYAQPYPQQQPFVTKYDERDGLFSPDCTTVFSDEEDNIWISSFESVSRFDGRTFKNYSRYSGLHSNAVYKIIRDKAGHIYVLAERGIYGYTGNSAKPFTKIAVVPDSVREDILAVDSGRFWLAGGSVTGGLYLVQPNKLERYFSNSHFIHLAKSKEGYVYALSEEEKIYVLKDTLLLGIITPPPNINIHLVGDHSGRIWYGNGIGLYRISGLHMQKVADWPADSSGHSFHIGRHTGDIYFFGNTIYKYHNGRWGTFCQVGATVFDGMEDRNGSLWIGTNDKGLWRITPNPVAALQNNQALPFVQEKGQLVLQADKVRQLPHSGTHQYILRTAGGMEWNCTGNGLYYRKDSGKAYKRYVSSDTSTVNTNDRLFLKAVSDGNGAMWFSSYNGIDRYSNGSFQHFSTPQGLLVRAIYDIATDRQGNVYAGASGLYTFEKGRFRTILQPQLGNSIVWSLCADPTGKMWAMDMAGKLYCLKHTPTGHIISDSIVNAIHNLPVVSRGIGFDKYGNLWFATRQFFFIYTPGPSGSYHSKTRLVLPAYNEETVKITAGSDGFMYLYNKSGMLAKIDTDSALQAARATPAVTVPKLTAISFTSEAAQLSDSLLHASDFFQQSRVHSFSYQQNDVVFSFAAGSVAWPQYVAYRYRLQGLDTAWQPTTVKGQAVYNNLSAGTYTLLVQASDIRQHWSGAATFRFVVQPPWYRSWWAYLLFFVLVIVFSGGLFLLGAKLARRRAEIKHLITEQQLKAIRAQINPHFLHNIFAFLSVRIQQNSYAAAESLEVLSHYIREVLYATDKSVVTLEEELEFAERYLEIQRLIVPVPFEYECTIDDEVDTIGIMVPSMLFQPILENAFKYGISKNKKQNKVSIRITQQPQCTCCAISDSGGNELPATKPGNYLSKGLTLTMERLDLLYRNLPLKPVIKQEPNNQGGTTVLILLPTRQKKH